MTPIGHTAAGYLVSYTALQMANAQSLQNGVGAHGFFSGTVGSLVLWGIFWSVAVDWDLLIAMGLSRSVKIDPRINHRRFASHAPAVWFLLSSAVYFLTTTTYGHYFALMMFLGSWFHFALDSIEPGIMWLWPFDKKLYSLFPARAPERPNAGSESVFAFYRRIFRENIMQTVTFRAEVCVVLIALIAAFALR